MSTNKSNQSTKVKTEEALSPEEMREYQILKAEHEARKAREELKKVDYRYFSDLDKGSSIPAYMLKSNLDMLKEEVDSMKFRLDRGMVPREEYYTQKEEYKIKKAKYESIVESKPTLTDAQKDELRKKRDKLGEEISRSLFSEYDMKKGLANANEEARRMSEPCIPFDETEAKRMDNGKGNMNMVEGKLTRNKAQMAWKLMTFLLGDSPILPQTAHLRKTFGSDFKKSQVMVPIDLKSLPYESNYVPETELEEEYESALR